MSNQPGTRLLLADDDLDDFELFKDAVSELSVPVTIIHCANGVELMHRLQTAEAPDVIFLDLNMPQKTGFECMREIRSIPAFQQMPVVIFSTSYDPEIVKILYKEGADRYIVKPKNFKDLKKVILQVLKLGSQTQLRRTSVHDFVLQP
jgi:CheY-like chemotaxis protein